MKFAILALFLSLPMLTPATAQAITSNELLGESSQLVDRLNSGDLNGADQKIDELAQMLVSLRAEIQKGSSDEEALNLAGADLDGAREFVLKSSL